MDTIEAEIIEDVIQEYYTIFYRFEGSLQWFSTSILKTTPTDALRDFNAYSNVEDFRLVKVKLPTKIYKEELK